MSTYKLRIAHICLFTILLLLATIRFTIALEEFSFIQHDSEERTFLLHIPDSYDGTQNFPLIVALHPSASSGKALAALSGLNDLAEEQGYIVAYPDALDKVWNDGRIEAGAQTIPRQRPIDDSGFINALIDELAALHKIDLKRVFLTGMGNGGTLAYRLASAMPERFQGIVVVSALLWDFHPKLCSETNTAINLLIIHGANDPHYPQTGRILPSNSTNGGDVRILGVNETLDFWARRNRCNIDSLELARNPTIGIYTQCNDEAIVAYYAIEGGGHNWPRIGNYHLNRFGVDATRLTGSFFAGNDDWTKARPEPFTGQARSYVLYIPPQYDPNKPMPMVVVLHGRPGNGIGMATVTEMNAIAAEEGFMVLYPDGVKQGWNYVRGIPLYGLDETDDTLFLSQLLEDLAQDVNIDQQRIYVTGFSNGGFMAQRLAREAPDQYAAFATVGATAFFGMTQLCEGQRAVPFMLIHGTDDISVPWGGTLAPVQNRRFYTTAPIPQTLGFWASHLGCDTTFRNKTIPKQGKSPATQVRVFEFEGCDMGSVFLFYAIEGGGHNWPGVPGIISPQIAGNINMDIHASKEIWNFFQQFTQKPPDLSSSDPAK